MTVSSGFFNSINHDRLYDAEQLSSIFDGIIIDGVYENYGSAFNVTALADVNSTVLVGTGRAWFDHTWTLNDSIFSITLDPPNEMLGRIDAIVIDVNKESGVRKNSIIYVKGSEASPDFPPTLINIENHHQYPIAYVTRHAEENGPIDQADITITVGTDVCPIVTGILESQNLENLMQQLDAEFQEWWDGIKDLLDENTATNLQNQIDEINEKLNSDTALVGLVQKPIAEAFMSGDYGLDISTYSLTDLKYANSRTSGALQDNVTLLPNGEACVIYFTFSQATPPGYGFFLHVVITDTNGVSTDHSQLISTTYMPGDQNQSSYTLTTRVFPLGINAVGGYPASFKYGILYFDGYNSNLSLRIMTIQVSSSGTVGVTYTDPASVATPQRKGSLSGPGTLVPLSDGSYLAISGIYFSSSGIEMRAWPCLISSDGLVVSNKLSNNIYSSDVGDIFNNKILVFHYINGKAVMFIPSSYPSLDYANNNPSDTGYRVVVEPETLDASVTNTGYTLPSRIDFKAKYGVSTYTLSEQNGVSASTIEAGESLDPVTEYISPYFMAATNLMESLPEGTFIAAKDPNGQLFGIGPGGEQIAIGTNGGAAILKTKKTVPTAIDISKVVTWLKGYLTTDDFTEYLLFTGDTNIVYPYEVNSMRASSRYGTVIKISKGV